MQTEPMEPQAGAIEQEAAVAQAAIARAISLAKTPEEAKAYEILAEESRLRFVWMAEACTLRMQVVEALRKPDNELRAAIMAAIGASSERAHEHDAAVGRPCPTCHEPCEVVPLVSLVSASSSSPP